MEFLKPDSEDELRDIVQSAVASKTALEIVSGASKRRLGRPVEAAAGIDLSAFSGISLYEPEELVVTAGTATPMAVIEEALAEHGQCLAFEPPDPAALLGAAPGTQTIGGVLSCNLAGPRRIKAGAARDHFLGVRAISGRGDVFKSGGRVVKNVTGYDMCKLLAGSHGTLAAMTEVTLKVLPAAEKLRTILVYGLRDETAMGAMSDALRSPHDVSASCHLPAQVASRSNVSRVRDGGGAVTAVRVEGPEPSVIARCDALRDLLSGFGEIEELHRHNSAAFWREVGDGACFSDSPDGMIWRLSVPPASGAAVVAGLGDDLDARWYYDWGGGLIWVRIEDENDAGHETVRRAIARTGGHATLVRAPETLRRSVPVFQPQPAPLAALTQRIKDAFDPQRILNPGRMYRGV